MRKNDLQYMEGFKDELKSFIGRVKDRAQARIDKAMKEYEEVSQFLSNLQTLIMKYYRILINRRTYIRFHL